MGLLTGRTAGDRQAIWSVLIVAACMMVIYATVWMPRVQGGNFAACYTAGFIDSILEGEEPLSHIWLGDEPIEREHLSLWFYVLAWVSRATGCAPLGMLVYVPFLLIPLGVVSEYCCFRLITRDHVPALVATVLSFIALQPGLGANSFNEQYLAVYTLVPWTLYSLIKALREGAWASRYVWIAGVGFSLVLLCHKGFAFWLLLIFAIFVPMRSLVCRKFLWRDLAVFGIIGLVTLLAGYEAFWDSVMYSTQSLGKSPYYSNPDMWVSWPASWWPVLRIGAFFSFPQLAGCAVTLIVSGYALHGVWRKGRRDPGELLIASFVVLELAIFLTPVGYLIGLWITFGFAGQFFYPGNVPLNMAAVAVGIGAVAERLARHARCECERVLVILGMVVVSGFGLFAYANAVLGKRAESAQEFLSEEVIEFCREQIPASGVVLSDPRSSFYLPAFAGRKVAYVRATATHKNHSARLADASRIFDEGIGVGETLDLMRKRKISHVLFTPGYWENRPSRYIEEARYGIRLPETVSGAMAKFRRSPLFGEINLGGGSVVFEVADTSSLGDR